MNHESGLWPPVCHLGDFPYPIRHSYPHGPTLRSCRPGDATHFSVDREPVEIAQPGADIFGAAAAFERDLFVVKPLEAVPTHIDLPYLFRPAAYHETDGGYGCQSKHDLTGDVDLLDDQFRRRNSPILRRVGYLAEWIQLGSKTRTQTDSN